MTWLLDVNVLLALTDPRHLHHDAAHRWFTSRRGSAWATCPITENGFVRVASHPSYPNRPGDAPAVLGILRRFCALPEHEFWADDVSVRDLLSPETVFTHGHITDLYLLALAVHHAGRLVTFDERITVSAIPGGPAAFEVVRP
jgi:uncharacterized protein